MLFLYRHLIFRWKREAEPPSLEKVGFTSGLAQLWARHCQSWSTQCHSSNSIRYTVIHIIRTCTHKLSMIMIQCVLPFRDIRRRTAARVKRLPALGIMSGSYARKTNTTVLSLAVDLRVLYIALIICISLLLVVILLPLKLMIMIWSSWSVKQLNSLSIR